jgi:16S rRNA C967 or C1407 C5-methylase (RsmB/RsmF family)
MSSFQEYFQGIYQERWPALFAALQDPERPFARPSAFSKSRPEWNGSGAVPRDVDGLLGYYVMDKASICAAEALCVQKGDSVLDMCAAPGGKSLILAEANPSELILNELSNTRRERLKKVIQQYIPRADREFIRMTGKDGGLFAKTHPEYFDRILVDAPCSGERHLLENAEELAQWSVKRSQKLAQRQYALLTAALLSCRAGGHVLYSTCSISPLENDAVIDHLLERKGESFKVVEPEFSGKDQAETLKHGYMFLPDRGYGGPIYLCLLQTHN